MQFIFAAVFGFILVFSWIGWGHSFAMICGKKNLDLGLSGKAIVGLCLNVAMGGWLNEWSLIGSGPLRVMVILGLCFLPLVLNNLRSSEYAFFSIRLSRNEKFFAAIVGLLFLINYLGSGATQLFMIHDDLHSYLLFPIRALQIGSFEGDFFSARRVESSLGGMSFLDCIFLSWTNFKYLNILDLGVGSLLFILGFLQFAGEKKIPYLKTILITGFILLIPTPWFNLTALLIGCALFFYLYFLIDQIAKRKELPGLSVTLLLSLIASTLVALKSTFLPPVFFIFFILIWLIKQKTSQKNALKWTLLALFISFLFLLPWMLALHKTAGTYFYPLLGHGIHNANENILEHYTILECVASTLKIFSYPAVLALLVLIGALFFHEKEKSKLKDSNFYLFPLLLSIALIVSAIIIGFLTGWTGTLRYSFPFVFPAVIFFLAEASTVFPVRSQKFISVAIAVVYMLIFVKPSVFHRERTFLQSIGALSNHTKIIYLRGGPNQKVLTVNLEEQEAAVELAQQSIPPNAQFMARLSTPFFLNFKRNPIFAPDFPGSVSPLPGMPIGQGPEALVQYLTGQSIRFVVYSYREQANYTPELVAALKSKKSAWIDLQSQETFDFQENITLLGLSRTRIYDDGRIFVLDLGQKTVKIPIPVPMQSPRNLPPQRVRTPQSVQKKIYPQKVRRLQKKPSSHN